MTPLSEWLKPPRTLLVILFLLTLVSVSALAWFGWKLLDQERIVETQRWQERLEHEADRAAALLHERLAETGDRLASWAAVPPGTRDVGEGLLLLISENNLTAISQAGLLYYPSPAIDPEAPAEVFSQAEGLEFLQDQPSKAIEIYSRMAESKNPAERAGALLRLARILRNHDRLAESRVAFERLGSIPGVRVAGVPAELVGRAVSCEIKAQASCAAAIQDDLLRGRWHVTRGEFEFYGSEMARLSGRPFSPPAELVALAEAAAIAWKQRKTETSSRGSATVWIGGEPLFLVWRGPPERRAFWVARPESLMRQAIANGQILCAAVDAEGRTVAGRRAGTGHGAIRTAAESQLPWTLYVTGAQAMNEAAMRAQQRFLAVSIAVMVLFLVVGTYFIARAIRRELEVSRMQSNFVAAVSHEFRSPLTSIRQLSEMLALRRVPSEERRQIYYETLVRETSRLQRLVEALLNFGRMEAGVRLYRFEKVETASLVQRVVAEFDSQIQGTERRIEMHGPPSPCGIEADPEAISVALRNLVDNALKYSPGQPVVWVEWSAEKERVAIRVRDRGPGVAPSERKAIFRKFVRGTAAGAGNVKGSGVGLAMVNDIVSAHGGEITVSSEPGHGSTFTMLLPSGGRA